MNPRLNKVKTLLLKIPLRRIIIYCLLVSVQLLPLLHLHPAHNHLPGELAEHRHEAAIHADFFPETLHGHEHKASHERDVLVSGVSIETSHHLTSQIDLFSLHVGQSLPSFSLVKKQPLALDQGIFDLSIPIHIQTMARIQQQGPPRQSLRFSPPTLRAPPYSA